MSQMAVNNDEMNIKDITSKLPKAAVEFVAKMDAVATETKNKYTEEEIAKIKKCGLHGHMYTNPGGLWYAPNSFGYSTYSPPCNGCKMGCEDRDRGLWMSGFGSTQ